jgi:flagellar basal body-associated protein FliL
LVLLHRPCVGRSEMCIIIIIIIIIIISIIISIIIISYPFMQGIYNYIPETNHVSSVYNIAAVL